VIDITLGSYGLLESITGWYVSIEPSLSDHRHILFTLRGCVPVPLIRNLRGTSWGSFREGLREKLEMNMKDEAGLGVAVQWIQQTLISAYEDNCPLRPVRKGRKSLRWTSGLESLRREVRRLFNRCRAPSGERTQSEGETLDLLLATHFPNSVMERGAAPATACCVKCLGWQVAARIVTYRRVRWAIDSFAPYKIPGMGRIFPALLQEGREVLIPYLIRIFRACLAAGYIPAVWRQVKVVFIPKPDWNSCCGPKDFRPISLKNRSYLRPWRGWWIDF
jgi:hypothetical protein